MARLRSPVNYMPVETRQLTKGLRCKFYRNGDQYFKPKNLLIPSSFKEVEDMLTTKVSESGRVRNIVTPVGGRVVKSLDQFEDGAEYVVTTEQNKFFIKRQYKDPAAKNRTNKSRKQETVIPILHSRQYYKQEGQAQKQNQEMRAIIVHVSKSGDMMGGAKPVNIRFPSTQSFTNVLIEIAAHWTLKANKIKLYKQLDLRGTSESFVQIHEVSDLSHGDHLVAHPYPPQWQPKKYSLTCGKGFDLGHATDVLKQTKSTPMPTHFRHDQTLNKHSPLGSIQSKTGTGQSSRKTPRETDLYKDKGGVFKAKNQGHARGAKQVKDTSDTRTERPIDQRKAEIVTEEENNTNKGKDKPIPKGTQVHKKPSEENGLPTEQKNTKGDKKSEVITTTSKTVNNHSDSPSTTGTGKKQAAVNTTQKDFDFDVNENGFPVQNGEMASNGIPPVETSPPGSSTMKPKAKAKETHNTTDDEDVADIDEVEDVGHLKDGQSSNYPQENVGADAQEMEGETTHRDTPVKDEANDENKMDN